MSSGRVPSGWDSYRLFFAQFRQHFVLTGAITPSGPALAQTITAPLARRSRQAPVGVPVRVLEVGAGTGVFTSAILRHLGPGDELDVYEINSNFRHCLQARLEAHAAAGVSCRLHIAGIGELAARPFDFIISALPLNNFSAAEVEAILKLLMSHLRSGGTLSYFEYPFVRELKRMLVTNPAERARLRAVGDVVHRFLGQHPSRLTAVPLNLPPAVAHHILKAEPA